MGVVDIKKFHKRNTSESVMFGYVSALRFNFPTMTLEKCILNFMKFYNVDNDLNVDTAIITYRRMNEEFIDLSKTL